MKHTFKRAMMELQEVRKQDFHILCRVKMNHFTRKRKLPLKELVLSIVARKGKTLVMELKGFFKQLGKKGEGISKAGYSKQRQKLNPLALKHLADLRASNFYKDTTMVKRLRGYIVLASDGSGVNLPNSMETIDTYGSSSRKGTKPQAQLGLGCMFDVINKMVVGTTINRYKFNERQCAVEQMAYAEELIGSKKVIYLFDRGYISGEMLLDLNERNTKYLIRVGTSNFKAEQAAMSSPDEKVTIKFTKGRVSAHRKNGNIKTADKLAAAGSVEIRFVQITLDNGEIECFATNLPEDEFDAKDIKYLYHLRWEIETAFDFLKNRLHIENFTGTKPIIIEQDIYAAVYLSNIIQDMCMEAQMEFDHTSEGRYKHRMAVNKNIAAGALKEALIEFVIMRNLRQKQILFEEILNFIQANIIPIREERKYERTKGRLAGKYSNVNKRSY